MTDNEIRQIINERDAYRRIARAYERKFGPVSGRSCLVICASRRAARNSPDGKKKGFIETHFCEDSRDSVAGTNFMRGVYIWLNEQLAQKATEVFPDAQTVEIPS